MEMERKGNIKVDESEKQKGERKRVHVWCKEDREKKHEREAGGGEKAIQMRERYNEKKRRKGGIWEVQKGRRQKK